MMESIRYPDTQNNFLTIYLSEDEDLDDRYRDY
jgi:hypothetical protein